MSLLRRPPVPWLGAILALTLAIGSGVLIAQLLMEPPAGDLRSLAAYFALSGAATTALGWAALRAADRAIGIGIQAKAFLGSLIATAVALLNIFIVAQLMFISTAHDLKLLAAITVFSAIVTGFSLCSNGRGRSARRATPYALSPGETAPAWTWRRRVSRLAADINTLAGGSRRRSSSVAPSTASARNHHRDLARPEDAASLRAW
jgi:hypothetical protein